MVQAGDEHWQAPPIQGLFINGRDLMFQALCFDLLSFSRFLLSWFFCIRFIIKCSEVLMGCPPDGAVAELFFIIVSMILLARRIEGANVRVAPIVLVRGVCRSLQTNSTCADPNVWETSDYAVKAAAVTVLAGLLVLGVINRPPPVPAVSEVVPALRIYPAVQGDDIDDVLENAPVATRRNSPLGSLL